MNEFSTAEWSSESSSSHQTFKNYVSLKEGTRSLPTPPRFWTGEFPKNVSSFYFHWQEIWPVGVYIASNIEISGPGMPSRNKIIFLCKELSYHINNYSVYLSVLEKAYASPPRYIEGNVVVLLGPGYMIYGHWLVDILPKLYLLEKAGFPFKDQRFLMPKDVPRFGLDWLHALGISDSQLVYYDQNNELTILETGIFPTLARTNSRTSSIFKEAVNFYRKIIYSSSVYFSGRDQTTGGRQLFVSRARSDRNARALRNRTQIETIAATAGFEIIHPEHLELRKQIELFASASSIVGEYGSAMHNCIFSPKGTRILALRGDHEEPGFLQSGIGEALAQPTAYVFGQSVGPLGEFVIDHDDFRISLSRLSLL